jgi:hypothetical protein
MHEYFASETTTAGKKTYRQPSCDAKSQAV